MYYIINRKNYQQLYNSRYIKTLPLDLCLIFHEQFFLLDFHSYLDSGVREDFPKIGFNCFWEKYYD